jgi:hypothetical protein
MPRRRIEPNHPVHAAQCMQRWPGLVQSRQINMPVLHIPKGEATGALHSQLGALIESTLGRIEAKPLDPSNVIASTSVLHAAIRSPHTEHVFHGGDCCCGHRWRLLASHEALQC